MAPFNAEEEVVTLYFISLGFKNKAVSGLLAHKCNSTRTADSVGIKWKGSKGLHGMWNIEADDWDLQAVGKYLAEIMPAAVEFEKLISVGAKEEEIVTTAVSYDCYLFII